MHALAADGAKCVQVRVYSSDKLIACVDADSQGIDIDIPLDGKYLDKFVRVEVEGEHIGFGRFNGDVEKPNQGSWEKTEVTPAKKVFQPLALSTPFYLVK